MNHVELTLAEIDAHIARLTTLKQDLRTVFPVLEKPVIPVVPAAPAPKRATVKRTPPTPHKTSTRLLPVEYIPKIAGLAEPFRASDVRAAMGTNTKNAQNLLMRMAARKWLTRISLGQYKRSAKFPAEVAMRDDIRKECTSEAPKEETSKPSIEEQIQEVCKLRDRAAEQGQTKLAAIHQRKIDELTALLG